MLNGALFGGRGESVRQLPTTGRPLMSIFNDDFVPAKQLTGGKINQHCR